MELGQSLLTSAATDTYVDFVIGPGDSSSARLRLTAESWGSSVVPAMTAPVEGSELRRGEIQRLVLAALLPLVACGLQLLFWSAIQPFVWFLFYPAVFFSSWIGSVRGGLVATVLSTVLVWYCFTPPQFSFAVQRPMAFLSIATFMGMGVLFSLFHGRLRTANQQAVEALAAVRSFKDQIEAQVLERKADLQQVTAALPDAIAQRFPGHLGGT
jgi:K+-sensing histidine kinase KdpD